MKCYDAEKKLQLTRDITWRKKYNVYCSVQCLPLQRGYNVTNRSTLCKLFSLRKRNACNNLSNNRQKYAFLRTKHCLLYRMYIV